MPYTGQNDAPFRLGLIAERIRRPRAMLEGPVTDELHEMFRGIFASNGAALGRPWAPLAPSTVFRKLMRGAGFGHILRDSDTLFLSLTERGAPQGYARVRDQNVLEVGTDVEYARFHRAGTRHMPRRNFMPDDSNIPADTVHNVLEIVKRHITLADDD